MDDLLKSIEAAIAQLDAEKTKTPWSEMARAGLRTAQENIPHHLKAVAEKEAKERREDAKTQAS